MGYRLTRRPAGAFVFLQVAIVPAAQRFYGVRDGCVDPALLAFEPVSLLRDAADLADQGSSRVHDVPSVRCTPLPCTVRPRLAHVKPRGLAHFLTASTTSTAKKMMMTVGTGVVAEKIDENRSLSDCDDARFTTTTAR